MTAKELKELSKANVISVGEPLRKSPVKDSDPPTDTIYIFTHHELKTFTSQLCKEQREICEKNLRNEFDSYVSYGMSDNILTSSQPKL